MARCAWRVLTACAFLTMSQPAAAQTLAEAAAARQAPPVDPAVRADIEKLMAITGSANLGAQMATQVSDAFLDSFKQTTLNVVPPRVIEIVREVLTIDFAKAFNGPEIKDQQIALYAKYFTHADIKGLIAFYETDLGRKAVANMPSLMREGGEIGQRWAQGALPEMLKVLEARLKAEGFLPQ
jgi:hypothetical protein